MSSAREESNGLITVFITSRRGRCLGFLWGKEMNAIAADTGACFLWLFEWTTFFRLQVPGVGRVGTGGKNSDGSARGSKVEAAFWSSGFQICTPILIIGD